MSCFPWMLFHINTIVHVLLGRHNSSKECTVLAPNLSICMLNSLITTSISTHLRSSPFKCKLLDSKRLKLTKTLKLVIEELLEKNRSNILTLLYHYFRSKYYTTVFYYYIMENEENECLLRV